MTSGAALRPAVYFRGAIGVALVVALLAWGAFRLRSALLPHWSGARARLAETIIALSAAFLTLQLLGWLHCFAPVPALFALAAVGATMAVGARWSRVSRPAPAAPDE